MRSRFRVLAALFALIALTLSVAEGVWASTCMPGMEMGTASAADMPAGADCMMDMAAPGSEHAERMAPPQCPFTPVSASGSCVVAASLPAASPVDLAPSPEGALLAGPPDQARNLLLVSAFFHPPRA